MTAPPLQVVRRDRPWTDNDLPRLLNVVHPSANAGVIAMGRTLPGNFQYFKNIITSNLYSCNTCTDINECLQNITGSKWIGDLTLKRGRFVTEVLNEIFAGRRCATCMGSGDYTTVMLPDGWGCSFDCENDFILSMLYHSRTIPIESELHGLKVLTLVVSNSCGMYLGVACTTQTGHVCYIL